MRLRAASAGQLATDLQLGSGPGQIQPRRANGRGDVVEESLDRVDAERREHPLAVRRRVRAVDHASAADLRPVGAGVHETVGHGGIVQSQPHHPARRVGLGVDQLRLRGEVLVHGQHLAASGA